METRSPLPYKAATLLQYDHVASQNQLDLLKLLAHADKDFEIAIRENESLCKAFDTIATKLPSATASVSIGKTEKQFIEYALKNRSRFACAQKNIFRQCSSHLEISLKSVARTKVDSELRYVYDLLQSFESPELLPYVKCTREYLILEETEHKEDGNMEVEEETFHVSDDEDAFGVMKH